MAEPIPPEERDALAAELALGLLEGEARAAALRLRLSDPGFAQEVQAWETRLAPLCAGFEEAPSPDLWAGIEARLDAGGEDVTALARRMRAWRWGAIGSGAVAAGLALTLVLRPMPTEIVVRAPDQLVVAQLDGAAAGVRMAANYDPAHGELRIRAIEMPDSPLAPELWVIPADGVPRSLGLVAAQGMSHVAIAMPHRTLMHDGAVLAITMEPREGAPHARPSSAPVASGKISTI